MCCLPVACCLPVCRRLISLTSWTLQLCSGAAVTATDGKADASAVVVVEDKGSDSNHDGDHHDDGSEHRDGNKLHGVLSFLFPGLKDEDVGELVYVWNCIWGCWPGGPRFDQTELCICQSSSRTCVAAEHCKVLMLLSLRTVSINIAAAASSRHTDAYTAAALR